MDPNKSKSVTTSVPSISVKFHANAEQIEEFYTSEDEGNSTHSEKIEKAATVSSSPSNTGESESSPLKIFPKLGKRSTSVDVSAQSLDASPPSDPWRFFSDIKGKITKSVEDKITEIKSRSHEEGSPQHKGKSDLKTIKDGKESSSVSDDEDLSESSISKTCGIISTTEGVEMSSDEDTPSLDKDKKEKRFPHSPTSIRHRFRFFRNKISPEEGTVKEKDLSKIYNITAEKNEEILREDSEDVESAVDALEEADFKSDRSDGKINVTGNENVLKSITDRIDNIEIDDENLIHIKEVNGQDLRDTFYDCQDENPKTVFAPTGFVDLRPPKIESRPFYNYLHILMIFLSTIIYMAIHYYSPYTAGLAIGIIFSYCFFQVYMKFYPMIVNTPEKPSPAASLASNKILEIQAVTEYQPLQKYEGWANELPDAYSPETYHISHTQSVFLRLQGNLLRISHAKAKVPKRAMYNEQEINVSFTHHRIYNLIGAKIKLLPEGLAKKRQWSKKYPICITLSKDQMCFSSDLLAKLESEDEKCTEKSSDKEKPASSPKEKKTFSRFRKKEYPILAQRFSKLTADDGFDLDSDSRASTPSADISDVADSPALGEEDNIIPEQTTEDFNSLPDDWSVCSPPKEVSPNELNIYIFGRTDREKEDWFRRLCVATHKGIGIISVESSNPDIKEAVSDALLDAAQVELEYLKYMNIFKCSKSLHKSSKDKEADGDTLNSNNHVQSEDDLLWLNSLIGRVLFDCMRDSTFIDRVKDRIQRKLSTIKLPYFIEELLIPELSLGKTPPLICRSTKPVVDDRGLWVDLDITYEGLIVLTLQTKLNLMRLKNPQAYEKSTRNLRSAIYHSDVDDSAESSSDEEGPQEIPNLVQDTTATPSNASSNSGHSGKKFIKMVDRLTESKIFQAATDNKYIKKAMEGVSNTDLRLTVEVRSIEGTLVLNVPPPPSDRIWIGFRPVPEIALSARPIVGERHLSYLMVTSWIEKKLLLEFQKVMVIPNMEDFVIPVMNPKLPE